MEIQAFGFLAIGLIVLIVIVFLIVSRQTINSSKSNDNDYSRYIRVVDPPLNPNPQDYNNPVPRKIHQIWLGEKPPPSKTQLWSELAIKYGYQYKLWRENDIENFGLTNIKEYRDRINKGRYQGASDVARYEILNLEGGLYCDADIRPLDLPIFDYLNQTGFAAAPEHNPQPKSLGSGAIFLANGFIVSSPNHPILNRIVLSLPLNYESFSKVEYAHDFMMTGPALLNACLTGIFYVIDKTWIMTDKNNQGFHLVEF